MTNLLEPTSLQSIPTSTTTRLPRVLMAAVRYYPFMGGVETHIYEVGRRLVEHGLDLTVITHDPDGKLPAEETVNGVKIIRVGGFPKIRDFTISPELVKRIKSGEWDIVHAQCYHALFSPLAMLTALQAHIPYVLSFHSGGHSSGLRNAVRGIQRGVLRPLLARADKLVAVSQFEADFFQEKLKLPADKFVVIPNGAKLPEIDHSVQPSTDEPLIVSIGRLERYKGHHRVIAAMPKILEKQPNARLRIAGGGPYEAELKKLATDLGVAHRVEIGAIPPEDRQGMARLLGQASLVTLLSDYEAHPIAVMEALSVGRPMLVANTSGLAEIADKGWARRIEPDALPGEVAVAVLNSLSNPLLPQNVTLPTWEACTDGLLNLYKSVVPIL
jgi:glycosyltransferase involved in cell wall biosynthesis